MTANIPDEVADQCTEAAREAYEQDAYIRLPDEVHRKLEDHGYRKVGDGLGRDVYQLPARHGLSSHVVKIATYGSYDPVDMGMFQNMGEVVMYHVYGDDYPLLPVEAFHDMFYWVVMPYADSDTLDVDVDGVRETMRQMDLMNDNEFNSNANFVVWDGDVYCCDYGMIEPPGADIP